VTRGRLADDAITFVDYFCGGGGSTSGLKQIGELVAWLTMRGLMAANHWDIAIRTHKANHEEIDHDRAPIGEINPARHPRAHIGWFSPECTTWTRARGKRVNFDLRAQQLITTGEMAKESEREQKSRMQMQDVPRFAEWHRYRVVIVENVTDILSWAYLDAWIGRMRKIGYGCRIIILNAAFAGGLGEPVGQLRDRVFFFFYLEREVAKPPDFNKWTRPRALCTSCGDDVQAIYAPKPGGRRAMLYGKQYVFRCPKVACRGAEVFPYAQPMSALVDWDIPAPPLANRAAEATKARILRGLQTFGPALAGVHGDGLLIPLRRNGVAKMASRTPFLTFAASAHHQSLVVVPGPTRTVAPRIGLRPVGMDMPEPAGRDGHAAAGVGRVPHVLHRRDQGRDGSAEGLHPVRGQGGSETDPRERGRDRVRPGPWRVRHRGDHGH